MCELDIDCEKLAAGLEDGLDPTGDSNFRKLYLRLPICGFVSTAVMIHLRRQDIPADTVLSKPNLPFDPGLEHVMVTVEDEPGPPTIIDATAGQFLKYTGYDIAYDNLTGEETCPLERVFAFRAGNRTEVARKVAQAALHFRNVEQRIAGGIGCIIDGEVVSFGDDWVPGITTEQQMISALEPIWNPANFHPYVPSGKTLVDGAKLSRYIDRAIGLVDTNLPV